MCKHCPPKQYWEEGYQHDQDSDRDSDNANSGSDQASSNGAFGKFKLFPAETQCMIYKKSFPDPQIIQFKFKIEEDQNHNEGRIDVELTHNLPANPIMLPLLQACKVSQNEVFRHFKEVKIRPLNTNMPHALFDEVENPEYKVFYHFLKCHFSAGNTSSSVYMRPQKDTLVLESLQLISLYRHGGYITMNNITRLALTDVDPRRWERVPGMPLIRESKVAGIQAHLFQLIRTHFPALEKIHIILADSRYWIGLFDVENELRIIDVDSEFPYQNFTSALSIR